jgi:dipeptidyl aminopeptidase/acylaminoacyl peptidase
MDIHDAYASVLALSKLGLVDDKRAVIHGGSAGGYSILQAATTLPNAFAVGSPHFGISDMRKLDAIMHKQEYFLCNRLMGGTWEECSDVWKSRSPVYHVDKIKMPMLVSCPKFKLSISLYMFHSLTRKFLQGEIDTIIPVAQMKEMVNKLKKNGNDVDLVIFPGEGHGWRMATTVKQSLEKESEYFSRVLGL